LRPRRQSEALAPPSSIDAARKTGATLAGRLVEPAGTNRAIGVAIDMQAYAHGPSPVSLLGETIGDALNRAADRHGDRDALISCHQQIQWTYAELLSEVNRVARALLALGVDRGDRVGLWSPNHAEWVLTQYAAAKVGGVLVNVNPTYRLRELEYALNQSGVSVLVAARRFRTIDYAAMLDELRRAGRLPSLRRVIWLGADPVSDGQSWAGFLKESAAVTAADLARREASLQFDDAANIQYTSGTTGSPKGATLSHHNILNNGFFVGETLAYSCEDRIAVPVPFYHCFGCVMGNLAALTHGAAVVVPAESFDPEATLRAIDAHRCTSLYGVPTMFIAMLDHPAFGSVRFDSLRTGIMAGAPCPVEVMRQVIARMHVPEVTICYGMTETSPVSFQSATDDPLELRVSTVGRVHPHVECKIVNPESGDAVDRGTAGELCTRGYSVMLGYWDDAVATAAAIDPARWMHTGDLAVMRDDGCVNIVGRLKDMIIRGGENIYPREIEEFLYSHPQISDVQVIGVPDRKYGEEICAWVRLRAGESVTADDLRAYCRGQIASSKIPRYIRFTTEFPTTVTGKIQKFRMREISIEELGLGVDASTQTA
jgi:fatty-acyl-CoA synthase